MPPGAGGQGFLSRMILVYGARKYRIIPTPVEPNENDVQLIREVYHNAFSELSGEFTETSEGRAYRESIYGEPLAITDPRFGYYHERTAYPQFGWSKFKSQQHAIGRELMIDVSERFLKPCYGQDIMAKLLRASVPLSFDGLILIRDSGFQCEVDPIIEWVGAENFLVCQVFRDGFDSFENDSREWVWNNYTVERFRRVGGEAGSMVPMTTMITNAGTLDQLKVEAGRLYGRCVNSRGWTF